MDDYYFRKWKHVVEELKIHVQLDMQYQSTKAHDRTCCKAAERLGGVLAKYMALYNDSIECWHQNLQMQKARYMQDVVRAITARILELKQQLRKLEGHNYQFVGNGLIQHILTFDDADPKDTSYKVMRSERMRSLIDDVILRTKEKKEAVHQKVIQNKNTAVEPNWWEIDEANNNLVEDSVPEIYKKLSEESIKRIEMIKVLQAHERSRQVISWMNKRKLKREMWEKELRGTLKPQAKYEMKERAGRLIQKVVRSYFAIKRHRVDQYRSNEVLGLNLCDKNNFVEKTKHDKTKEHRADLQKQSKKQWESNCEELKSNYLNKEQDNICEEYRDLIRDWFRKWFEEVKFFYDIPKDEQGSALIIKEDVPTPSEWKEKYEDYLEEKRNNKNKTGLQVNWEKSEAKREEIRVRREEFKKLKLEEALLKKMMKNPNMHPGFLFPESKNTEDILKVIENYRKDWHKFDSWETEGVKKRSVKEVDVNNACMYAKIELLKGVDDDMRRELQILKKALRNDYKGNNEKMPEAMKIKSKQPKRKRKLKSTITESVQDKMEDLAAAGFFKQCSKIKLEDFLGDFNFIGDDLRCTLQTALPLGGEMRFLWWERCNELVHGSRRILLIGPQGSGKTTLVHILASVNDAMLFELDPSNVPQDFLTPAYLRQIVSSVTTCARAVQPSVIHVKCLHLLYCKKVPHGGKEMYLEMCNRFFVINLMKKIRKNDMITVIGSCRDPWLTKSNQLLKKFPEVIMLPDTTYSTVSLILSNWMTENRIVPRNLNTQCLAQVLQGYSFGYLREALSSFLTPENIVRIAAYGLSPQELVNHVTRDGNQEKNDYKKYYQWYTDKTFWGRKEAQRLDDDKEFKLLVEKFAEKAKKNVNRGE